MTTEEMLLFTENMRRLGAKQFAVQDADGSISVEFDPNAAVFPEAETDRTGTPGEED